MFSVWFFLMFRILDINVFWEIDEWFLFLFLLPVLSYILFLGNGFKSLKRKKPLWKKQVDPLADHETKIVSNGFLGVNFSLFHISSMIWKKEKLFCFVLWICYDIFIPSQPVDLLTYLLRPLLLHFVILTIFFNKERTKENKNFEILLGNSLGTKDDVGL